MRMNKTKARVDVTDAEIDAAIACGKVYEQFAPQAVAAGYRDPVVVVTFASAVELAIPRRLLQGLEHADERELAKVEIVGDDMLHWESLDVDHYIPSLLAGVFGNRRWMSEIGRRGGTVRSGAKTRAARKNGRKGGRPRKAINAA